MPASENDKQAESGNLQKGKKANAVSNAASIEQ